MPTIPLPGFLLPIVALLPLALLLGGLTVLNWSARLAAIASFALAVVVAVAIFGIVPLSLGLALLKGILSALNVLLVVWGALLLYSLVDRLGAVESIGTAMANSTRVPAVRALMMGWGFSGFLQGIAGFGAPVASVVPLLSVSGFPVVSSIAAAMVGHSWAITFGSMGSSFLAIMLVSRLDGAVLAPWIALLFPLPILTTGLSVLHLLLGWDGVKKGGPLVLLVGAVIAVVMWAMASIGAFQIASTVPALVGCTLLWMIGRRLPPAEKLPPGKMAFHLAFLPYYLLIVMTVATQLGPLGALTRQVSLGFDFPPTVTSLGYSVAAELGYPRLRILAHPITIILLAIAIVTVVYRARGVWPTGTFRHALRLTYRRSIVSSTAVAFMVMTALVMTDAGMSRAIADGIRTVAGPAFPVLSPFIGVLGAFMTGSNTNSNIMMGALQVETAIGLGIAPVLIAAAQTVGGSLGSGISPDKAVIGATVASAQGSEGHITRMALPYGLLGVAAVGLQVFAMVILGIS